MAIGQKKKKRTKTKEEKAHLVAVSQIGCLALIETYDYLGNLIKTECGVDAQVHHKTGGGMGLKSSNFDTMPLCHYHHLGSGGIHQIGVKTWEAEHGTQEEMIEKTKRIIKNEL